MLAQPARRGAARRRAEIARARRRGGLLGARVVVAIGAAVLCPARPLEFVMAVDFALQLRRDLLVVLEGGPVLGRLLVHGDLDSSTVLVLAGYRRPGEQGRVGAQKAHLHAYVLQTVV